MTGAKIELRCDQSLIDGIDAEANAMGLSRSAWVRSLIASALDKGEEPTRATPAAGTLERAVYDRQRVELRFAKLLLKRIDEEAEDAGLSRNDYIRRALHGRLYRGSRYRVLSARTRGQFNELLGKMSALQRMVNRIEKAVNAIVRDSKHADLEGRADELADLADSLLASFNAVQSFIVWSAREEHIYWRGGEAEGEDAD